MSKVSIIVPVYNVEKYLEKCLYTLVNQTLKDIEIIVVNDGSPDNSSIIIDKFSKKYKKKIKVLNQENQGLSDARNNGLKLATADYIMFVDSDDYVELDFVEKMYNKAISEAADVVICGNNVVSEDYHILETTYPQKKPHNNMLEKIIFGNMCAWNKLYKKELIQKINFRSRVWYEDLDYSFKTMTLSKKTVFLEENLYNYLLRSNSIMNSKNLERNLELLLTFDEILKYSNDQKYIKKYYNEIEFLATNHIYISGITRILLANATKQEKNNVIIKFINYLEQHFPNYKKNPYLKQLSFNRKLVLFLLNLKQYTILTILFKIKGVI